MQKQSTSELLEQSVWNNQEFKQLGTTLGQDAEGIGVPETVAAMEEPPRVKLAERTGDEPTETGETSVALMGAELVKAGAVNEAREALALPVTSLA